MVQVLPGGGVVVRAPLGTSGRQIQRFLEQHAQWIAEKKSQMAEVRPNACTYRFEEGERIWFAGRQYPLHLTSRGPKELVFREDRGFELADQQQSQGAERLKAFYRHATRQGVNRLIDQYAAKWGLKVKAVRITNAKRRWGSCSRQNSLNFSLRLAMVPPEAMEYVVVHELAHTRHHNHSSEFWGFVRAMLPGFQAQRAWLRQNGIKLPDF